MSAFINVYDILSHNCLFNFLISQRNIGKTYGCKMWAINDFLKNGSQFIYLRRYKPELKRFKLFWNDIRHKYPEHEFEIDGDIAYIDGDEAGYALSLSSSGTSDKSVPYFDVNKIIFDEFLINKKSNKKYLQNEVDTFLELYNTIVRIRENEDGELYQNIVKVMFLANNVSLTNPYFLEFNINLEKSNKFKKNDMYAIKYTSKEFSEILNKTRVGKMLANTKYSAYAFNNESLYDNSDFIDSSLKNCSLIFGIKYKNKKYGCYFDNSNHNIKINNKIDPNLKIIYTIKADDFSTNTMLVKSIRKNPHLNLLCDMFMEGNVKFENIDTKNQMIEVIKKCIQ